MSKKDDPTKWDTDQDWESGLKRMGFKEIRHNKHMILRRGAYTAVLPTGHSRQLSPGVKKSLLRILAEAGLMIAPFLLAGWFLLRWLV